MLPWKWKRLPFRQLRSALYTLFLLFVLEYSVHDLLFHESKGKDWHCLGFNMSKLQQSLAGPQPKKYLITRLRGLSENLQLGNQVFEILGLESVARRVGRVPVFLISDPWNNQTISQMWNALMYFPHIFEGYELWNEPDFNLSSLPTAVLNREYNTWHNLEILERRHEEPIIHLYGAYFQNYRYLEDLGRDLLRERLRQPDITKEFARDLLPPIFHQAENRLCIHMRRGDFVGNPSLIHANLTYTIWAVERIMEEEFDSTDWVAAIFSDDAKYSSDVLKTIEYKSLNLATYLPRLGSALHPTPKQFYWEFLSNYCTHILLSAGESTFGFFAAYLAGDRARVFYNPIHKEVRPDLDLPPQWMGLTKGIVFA